MCSNSSNVIVIDATDYGSDGGGSTQLRLDQCDGGVIRAAAANSARRRCGSGAGAVGQCGRGVLARCDGDAGDDNGESGAVWEASAGGDQTESFDLLIT
jgi:hypothetical protein